MSARLTVLTSEELQMLFGTLIQESYSAKACEATSDRACERCRHDRHDDQDCPDCPCGWGHDSADGAAAWVASRPPCIRKAMESFPPASSVTCSDGRRYVVVGYEEEDDECRRLILEDEDGVTHHHPIDAVTPAATPTP